MSKLRHNCVYEKICDFIFSEREVKQRVVDPDNVFWKYRPQHMDGQKFTYHILGVGGHMPITCSLVRQI